MKTRNNVLISWLLVLGLTGITHAAKDEVKLVGAPDGMINKSEIDADIVGDTIVIGAYAVAFKNTDGFAKIYTRVGKKWEQTAKLIPSDQNMEKPGRASFGFSVAITGSPYRGKPEYIIVGAPAVGEQGAAGLDGGRGAAYIYSRNEKKWKEQQKLAPQGLEAGDNFGWAVDITNTTAVVGIPKDDEASTNAGSVYVFIRDGNTWKQQAKLSPTDAGRSDSFGETVALVEDTLVVGAPGHSPGGIRFGGAAYVFGRDRGQWKQQAKLVADDAAKSDRFGASVDLGGDTIIVGSTLNDARGKDSGAAYIFVRNGNTWKQQAKLVGDKSKAGDHFGTGVAITGKIAIIGAPLREDAGLGAGAAYSFVNIDGVWQQKAKIGPENPAKGILFGSVVAVSTNTAIVTGGVDGHVVPGFANGSAAYVYSTIEHFGTPPFAVGRFESKITTLGQVKHATLYQNFPNPFNPETWFPYRLPIDAPVRFLIYNVQGQLTRELNLGFQKSGRYMTKETSAHWDGRDKEGEVVASGVYFYTLQTGSFQATRRMLVLK